MAIALGLLNGLLAVSAQPHRQPRAHLPNYCGYLTIRCIFYFKKTKCVLLIFIETHRKIVVSF